MLLVSHVWWEPAFLELGKGSYGVRDGNSVIPTCVGAHINTRDDGRHHGTYARDHVDEAVGGSVRLAVGGNVLATRRVTY